MLVLEGKGRHLLLGPAVEEMDFLRAQPARRVRRVDGGVAPAYDGHALPDGKIRLRLVALDEVKRIDHAAGVLPRNAQHVHGAQSQPRKM